MALLFRYGRGLGWLAIQMTVPAQHLSLNGHACRKIDDIMDSKHLNRKRAHMDTMKTFFIPEETKKNNQLNDKNIVIIIFLK